MPAQLFTDFAAPEAYRPHLREATLWVVDGDHWPIAFLAARAHARRLHIDELDVAREHQGQGIGRRLLGHAIQYARTHDFSCLSLTTFRAVPWNAPFYATLGFLEWDPQDAPDIIHKALAKEAAFGLKDRCAMRLIL